MVVYLSYSYPKPSNFAIKNEEWHRFVADARVNSYSKTSLQ